MQSLIKKCRILHYFMQHTFIKRKRVFLVLLDYFRGILQIFLVQKKFAKIDQKFCENDNFLKIVISDPCPPPSVVRPCVDEHHIFICLILHICKNESYNRCFIKMYKLSFQTKEKESFLISIFSLQIPHPNPKKEENEMCGLYLL